jgi:hypothetical protein
MEHAQALKAYQYDDLPSSFRLLELLPGKRKEPIVCLLHTVHWYDHPKYDALSYTWGDLAVKVPFNCHGGRLDITVNLQAALVHLRFEDHSRMLWIDAIWFVNTLTFL